MRTILLVALALLTGCTDDGEDEARGEGVIVFSSNRDGDFELYVVRPDGSGLRRLTHNERSPATEARDEQPALSPEGRTVAFVSTRDHQGNPLSSYELYVIGLDGRGERRLTRNGRVWAAGLGWTPDGRVVITACPRDDLRSCRLEAVDPETGDRRRFSPLPSLSVFYGAELSSDGERLALVEVEGGFWDGHAADVVVARVDGSERRRLTDDPGEDSSPVWSPDGSRIAFISDRDRDGRCLFHDCIGHAGELYVMDADGSDQRRLTRTAATESSPSWSPDGRRIVFSRIADEDADPDLYIVNVDTGAESRLADSGAWDWMPAWG
jgi:Tol biopolymer transport system component